ncbi:flagellar assembly protein FliW [Paradesulfitobacterium ferrireducens]|uniref:flagellar assembly protein FliW n=1 Tax=Paradesulfitobacterium ferrireducens TaxID=2816476 RepID=UPI001A8F664D|nr:flagellar assembly protein FliW [Paradesulfitobacterium ferrireducens]
MSASQELKPQKAHEYYFPKGLPGFEETRYFQLLEEEMPFAQLVAADDDKIGFILIQPEVVGVKNEWEIDPETEQVLRGGKSSESQLQLEVWLILTLNRQDVQSSTVNLKAPLILNPEEKLGVQLILDDERYSSRQPLVKQQAEKGVKG